MSKRYQLFKADNSDPTAIRPCAFFNSDKGCKSGDACKFQHGANDTRHLATAQQQKAPVVDPPKVESSKKRKHKKERESSLQTETNYLPSYTVTHAPVQSSQSYPTTPAPQQQLVKEKSSKKKRKERHDPSSSAQDVPPGFQQQGSNSVQLPVTPFSSNSIKNEDDDESSFLFGVVNTALAQGQIKSPPAVQSSSNSNESGDMFLSRNSVGQRLQTSGTDHATNGAARKVKKSKSVAPVSFPAQANIAPALPFNFSQFPVTQFNPNAQQQQQLHSQQQAQSTVQQQQQHLLQQQQQNQNQQIQTSAPTVIIDERVVNWRPYVQSTVACPRFSKDYNFDMDHSWVQAKPHGDWCKNLPPVVAIDCEMCETTDPVTGVKDGSTLIRFSMVNGLNPSEVIVDSLVNPLLPISNMRNQIHGIDEDALRNVQFTLRHAQALLMNTVSDRTVIVGHALHHDLKSLKFNHKCAVDTSYIYQVINEPGAAPGLRDCAQQALNQTLSPLHDSVEDAQFAAKLAAHVVTNGFQPPIVRVGGPSVDNKTSLMIHRIPKSCGEDQVKRMFAVNAYVIPKTVNTIQHPAAKDPTANVGKTDAVFDSVAHADLAFETLPGPDRPDKSNRSQKRVYLHGGGYICVRKY